MPATRVIRQLLASAAAIAAALAGAASASAAVRHCQPTAQDYYYGVQSVIANPQTSCRLADNFALVYERDLSLQSDAQPYSAFTIGQGPGALRFALRLGSPPGEPQTSRVRARQIDGDRWISFDAGQ